ncbi:MAG: response regulator transcription factor [Acidobacteriota bacterium]|nr:response regulator transcription factor [Acidobacteriota bacterium]
MIRVAILEDQRDIREGLKELIDGAEGLCCSATFGSVEEVLRNIGTDVPDLVLVDIGLPGKSGIEGIRLLKQRYPDLLPLVLTVFEDDRRIFDAICVGACGYLLKNTPAQRLVQGIRDAAAGGAPMSPEIAARMIALFRRIRPAPLPDNNLTPHELRVLKLLVDGHNYKTAAIELSVSVNTISFHVRRIYDKLHVHTRSDAVVRALRDHIVE